MLEVLRIMSAQLRMYRMRMMSVSKNGDQSNDLQRVNGAVYLFVRSNNSCLDLKLDSFNSARAKTWKFVSRIKFIRT